MFHIEDSRRLPVAAILFSCLFAAQSGQLALTPVLTDAAHAFGLSTAAAGQIRTAAAVVAAVAALAVGGLAGRAGLRRLLRAGVVLLVAGAVMSLFAPSALVLAAGQAVTAAASSTLVAAGVAAAAAWTDGERRGRVVAWALAGAPAAWIVAMPAIGVVTGAGWRLAFAVPVAAALLAGLALLGAPAGAAARSQAGMLTSLGDGALRRWALGEALAYAAWSGVLVYAGALFVESYGTSRSGVGVLLGVGAAAYIPGTFAAERIGRNRDRQLLTATAAALAAGSLAFGALRPGAIASTGVFAALCFLAGARTYLGSAVGLALAPVSTSGAMAVRSAAAQAGWILGSSSGGAALALGGYPVLGFVLASLFAAAALTPRRRTRATRPAPPRCGAVVARAR
jgi:DHA1 family inner membrane transport protein